MLPAADWLLIASICVLGAITPGASLAVVMRHTLSHGPGAGARAGLGHGLGMGLYALLTVTGLAQLMTLFPPLQTALTLLGSLFLCYLAWQAWQQGDAHPASTTLSRPWRDGFLIAFLNPKVPLFFIALFSPFVSAELGSLARLQLVLTVLLIDGGWYVLLASGLGRSPLLPWLQRRQAAVNRCTAGVLLLIALIALNRLF